MKTGYVVMKATCYGFCNEDVRDIEWEADCSEVYPNKKKAEAIRNKMIKDDIKEYKEANEEFEYISFERSEADGVKSVAYCPEGDLDQEVKYYIKAVQIMD